MVIGNKLPGYDHSGPYETNLDAATRVDAQKAAAATVTCRLLAPSFFRSLLTPIPLQRSALSWRLYG